MDIRNVPVRLLHITKDASFWMRDKRMCPKSIYRLINRTKEALKSSSRFITKVTHHYLSTVTCVTNKQWQDYRGGRECYSLGSVTA